MINPFKDLLKISIRVCCEGIVSGSDKMQKSGNFKMHVLEGRYKLQISERMIWSGGGDC